MKVLIADDAHTFGGAQIAAVNMARYLNETMRYDVFFFCPASNERLSEKLKQVAHIQVSSTGHTALPYNILTHIFFVWRVVAIMRRFVQVRPDVVVVNMAGLEFGWLYIYAAKLLRIRTICWLHNPYRYSELVPQTGLRGVLGRFRDRCAELLGRFIFRDLHTVSRAARAYLLARFSESKGVGILGNVIYSTAPGGAASENPYGEVLGAYRAARVALVPGRISYGDKGQDRLIASLPALEKNAIAVVFVGDGSDLAHLRAACSGFANVFFVGWQQSVDRYIEHADVVLLPSRFEAQPLVAMEVMTLGVRVLTSDIPPFVELAGARFTTDFTNSATLCQAIDRICAINHGELLDEYRVLMSRFSGPVFQEQVRGVFSGGGR